MPALRARGWCAAIVLAIAATSRPSYARADTADVRAVADAACAARSDLALAHPAVRVLRLVGDPTTTPSDWHVADAGSLARIARDPDIYSEVADVWLVDGHVTIVNIESRSLELREDSSYCFRADGTLARLESTSSGTINIDDESRYFDAAGRIVATSSKLALLYPKPGATVSPDLKPAKPDVFLRVEALPFYRYGAGLTFR